MKKEMQGMLAELYAIRAAMSLICERYPKGVRQVAGARFRFGKEKNASSLYFSPSLCFWKRMWSNFTDLYLISFLAGTSSVLCTVLDLLFPILQISAVLLLAVFGALGMLNFGLPMKLLCILLVLSPALLRAVLCIAVSIRDVRKNRLAFSASREGFAQARALLKAAAAAYPCVGCGDWGKTDLLIYLLESGRAADIEEALRAAERQTEGEGPSDHAFRTDESAERSLAQLGSALGDALDRLKDVAERETLLRALREEMSAPSARLAEEIRRGLCAEEG